MRAKGDALLESLDADATTQRKRLETLLATLRDGDLRRGQTLFNSTKAACAACHAIGYQGGIVGPDTCASSRTPSATSATPIERMSRPISRVSASIPAAPSSLVSGSPIRRST